MVNVISLIVLVGGFILTVAGMFGGFEYTTKLGLCAIGITSMLVACVLWIFADMWRQ